MNEKIILVTGATGRQGSAVIRHLLKHDFKVRAITRAPEKPSSQSLKSKGVEVFKGDMEDIPSLHQAMKGVYEVFSIQNYWEKGIGYDGEIRQARNLAQVASYENVSHFVQSSLAGCDNAKGVEHFESKWEIEKITDSLHLPRTFIRVVFFMENFIDNRKLLFPGLAGALESDTRLHMISVDDIGWFVAESFANPAVYLGKAVDIAGDSLTVAEIKQVYKNVTGKNPSSFKLPFWIMKVLSSENAKQLQWNNEVGWRFDIQKVRQIHPEIISFEKFLRAHPQIQF
jgi:uncharacterized protein YbjT (DUF2867 family)